MNEYIVRVKDHTQDTTHEITEQADSPNQANSQALKYLRKYIGDNEYSISSTKPRYAKFKYKN